MSRKRRLRPCLRAHDSTVVSSAAGAALSAKRRGDVHAGELAGRVEADAASGCAVGAQQQKEREAGARELVEGLVDLLLGRLAVEVADCALREVVA